MGVLCAALLPSQDSMESLESRPLHCDRTLQGQKTATRDLRQGSTGAPRLMSRWWQAVTDSLSSGASKMGREAVTHRQTIIEVRRG
jgi:hypothetical protein